MLREMTIQMPEALAERIQPIGSWLPTVLELSLAGFRTLAVITATEIIEFLSQNPTPQNIMEYHVSERAQSRLQKLLTLNQAGLVSSQEMSELDEIEKIEHIMIMLKAQATQKLNQEPIAVNIV